MIKGKSWNFIISYHILFFFYWSWEKTAGFCLKLQILRWTAQLIDSKHKKYQTIDIKDRPGSNHLPGNKYGIYNLQLNILVFCAKKINYYCHFSIVQ